MFYLQDSTLILRGKVNTALDFFTLFITEKMIDDISTHTNTYRWYKINNTQYYSNSAGAWKETNAKEIRELIALLLYWVGTC